VSEFWNLIAIPVTEVFSPTFVLLKRIASFPAGSIPFPFFKQTYEVNKVGIKSLGHAVVTPKNRTWLNAK